MTIHDKAFKLSRSSGLSLEAAYSELSRRSVESRRRRTGRANHGKTLVRSTDREARTVVESPRGYWWNQD